MAKWLSCDEAAVQSSGWQQDLVQVGADELPNIRYDMHKPPELNSNTM